ncbi:FCD domain-containing protein, partial [Trebonia sp.]|uniref:FCD domain-containing protein n=1 Tax=Trebonia sp. TaxID=2767075 RepID=UPI003CC5383B
MHARINLLRSLSLTRPDRAAESMAELAEIVAAIAANDADAAAKACGRHVEAAGMAAFQRPHPGSGRLGPHSGAQIPPAARRRTHCMIVIRRPGSGRVHRRSYAMKEPPGEHRARNPARGRDRGRGDAARLWRHAPVHGACHHAPDLCRA